MARLKKSSKSEVQLSGRNVVGDEVVTLDGSSQSLASIPATATIALVSVEADDGEGVRIRMNSGDPTTLGMLKANGDEFIIGFDNTELTGFRFIRTGGTGGQIVVWYYE